MLNIALLVPGDNIYSETFVRVHISNLKGNIKYYHTGLPPLKLEGVGYLYPIFNHLKFIPILFRYLYPSLLRKIALNSLSKSFSSEKIQIVFCEFGTMGAEVASVCKKNNLPLIVHFHGLDASVSKILNKYKNKYLFMFNYTEKIIVVSEIMRKKLISLGAPTEKIVKAIYGPNNAFLSITPYYNSSQFVSVGRFVEKKGPSLTIKAFGIVLDHFPDAKLVMCGAGPLLNKCKKLVKNLKIKSSVSFLGITNPEEIKSIFQNSIAFVQHSIIAKNGDMEGAPVAILEASGSGLPVISTRHAGIKEMILDGETGILVNEGDINNMAMAMIVILKNRELIEIMGYKGKQNIIENFSIDKNIQFLNEIIQDVYSRKEHKNQHYTKETY